MSSVTVGIRYVETALPCHPTDYQPCAGEVMLGVMLDPAYTVGDVLSGLRSEFLNYTADVAFPFSRHRLRTAFELAFLDYSETQGEVSQPWKIAPYEPAQRCEELTEVPHAWFLVSYSEA